MISDNSVHNCDVINDPWESNDRVAYELNPLQSLDTTIGEEINYAVVYDTDPQSELPFSIQNVSLNFQKSKPHGGSNLLSPEWFECVPSNPVVNY